MRRPKRPRPPASAKRPRPGIGKLPARPRIPHVPKTARRPAPPPPPRPGPARPKAQERSLAGSMGIFGGPESNATLLDLVDNLLNRGVVLHADAILALADVDLVYLRLTALLVAADRVFPKTARKP